VIPARRLAALLVAVPLLTGAAVLAGCSGSAQRPAGRAAPPFADCAGLTSAPAAPPAADAPASAAAGGSAPSAGAAGVAGSAGPASSAAAAPGAAGDRLPDLALPCFTGGQNVDIGQIKGPALINLWASWCPPCRQELPALQRLAGRAAGRLHVIGVVSDDDRGAAQSLAEDLGITFPALYDREGALRPQVGAAGLPATVFVGASGRISYVYNSTPLDDAALTRLVRQHLGLAVPS
jgi:thiol-disulfide isomerase/thioredoxin